MALSVNSLLSTLRYAPLKFISTNSYTTTTKKVAALICVERQSSGTGFVRQKPTTTMYLPSSQLIVSKSKHMPFCFDITHVSDSYYEKHYLSGDVFSYTSGEEEGDVFLEIKKVTLIPAATEMKLEKLSKEKKMLQDLRFQIKNEIAEVEDEMEKTCEGFEDLFNIERLS